MPSDPNIITQEMARFGTNSSPEFDYYSVSGKNTGNTVISELQKNSAGQSVEVTAPGIDCSALVTQSLLAAGYNIGSNDLTVSGGFRSAQILSWMAFLLCTFSSLASAQDCLTPIMTTVMRAQCAVQEENAAKTIMDEKYDALQKAIASNTVDPDSNSYLISELKDTEKRWISFADKQCIFEGNLTLGSAAGFVQPLCLKRLYQERTRWIESNVAWLPGNTNNAP